MLLLCTSTFYTFAALLSAALNLTFWHKCVRYEPVVHCKKQEGEVVETHNDERSKTITFLLGYVERLKEIIGSLEEKYRELQRTCEKLQLDGLTGLLTRGSFDNRLKEDKRQNPDRDIAVAFLDINNFKRVNDKFGHQEGDNLLQYLAGLVVARVRSTDYAVRWGGDEILLVLNSTNRHYATRVVEEIAAAFDAHVQSRYNVSGEEKPVSLAYGIVSGSSLLDSIQQADRQMYMHKRQKNTAPAL